MDNVFFSKSISIKILPERIKQSLDLIKSEGSIEFWSVMRMDLTLFSQKYCAKIGLTDVTVYTISEVPTKP